MLQRRDENRQSTLLVSQARRLAHEFLEIRVVATALVSRSRVSEKHLPPTKVGNTKGKVLPWEYGHTLMVLRKCQTSALFIRKFLIHPLVPWRAWGDPLWLQIFYIWSWDQCLMLSVPRSKCWGLASGAPLVSETWLYNYSKSVKVCLLFVKKSRYFLLRLCRYADFK